MKLAVSNIGLSAYDHHGELSGLQEMGLEGLEVAPSRVWHDTWQGLTPVDVRAYRKQVESAGIKVVGLHSLLFDHPELSLFHDVETRARTLDFMVHLSGICRDLGGRTLIFGKGRTRGNMPLTQAFDIAIEFFTTLCRRIEKYGVLFCVEPLGPRDTDFINSALDSVQLVEAVNHPALRVQLDAKALVANQEAKPETFKAAKKYLVHYHANQPDLGVLDMTGDVDHAALGRMLGDIGYAGYVSIEQRMLNKDAPLDDISASAAVLRQCYK